MNKPQTEHLVSHHRLLVHTNFSSIKNSVDPFIGVNLKSVPSFYLQGHCHIPGLNYSWPLTLPFCKPFQSLLTASKCKWCHVHPLLKGCQWLLVFLPMDSSSHRGDTSYSTLADTLAFSITSCLPQTLLPQRTHPLALQPNLELICQSTVSATPAKGHFSDPVCWDELSHLSHTSNTCFLQQPPPACCPVTEHPNCLSLWDFSFFLFLRQGPTT